MELPFSYNSFTKNVLIAIATLLAIAISMVVVVNLNYPLLSYNGLVTYKSSTTTSVVSYEPEEDVKIRDGEQEECDIFTGEWIPNPDAPYYTNKTCWAIHEHQNCMKYGRPDTEFLKWRWKPDGCELPVFDPYEFLEMVRNRSMAFVGDSVGRNQMQSLICLLSRVEYPIDVSTTQDERFKRLVYINYNFTIVSFWTTFLTRAEERDSDGPTHTGLFNLYLDEPDQSWATQIDGLDYLILSAGHWFSRPAVYYERRKITGCLFCQLPNVTSLSVAYGYRHAFRTALKAINERKDFKGTTFLRTFAPAHFENGGWNGGGNCIRQRPFKRNETVLEGGDMEFYTIQSQELRVAKKEGEGKKSFMLLDTTKAMLLRPDGHPSRYGHLARENVTLYNDCVHWCLPGPIDSWADLLVHMMKTEARKLQERRVDPQRKKDAIRKAL